MKKNNNFKKIITTFCVLQIVISPALFLFLKSAQTNVNIEVENLKKQISLETNKVESLTMKIDELKSLANLESAIENEGLGYNSTNIKVLSKN